jgi:outer membrane receptor protein involved in Fe transport
MLQKWEPDTTISNHFIYKENINAGYISLRKQIKKFTTQLGLRGEQTVSDGDQTVKKIAFHKNYFQLFPTAYFSYQENDNNTFGLSYGRRVERPDYQSLNPFQSQLDRYTYDQGNPNLQPQFSHNIELSYNYKGRLNVTANYTVTTDIISQVLITVKQPGDSNYTTYNTSANLASLKNFGLSMNYSRQINKWWSLNVYGNVFNNHYKGVIDGQAIDLAMTSFNGNFSSQFAFNKGWSAEASGFYNSRGYADGAVLSQGRGMFSLGAGKKVLKDKAAIKLNLRDPLYLMDYGTITDLNKSLTRAHYKWDNRRIILTLVYRFGKTGNSGPEHKSSADDEQSRVKSGGQQ